MLASDFVYITYFLVGTLILAYVMYKIIILYKSFALWLSEMRKGNDLSLTLEA